MSVSLYSDPPEAETPQNPLYLVWYLCCRLAKGLVSHLAYHRFNPRHQNYLFHPFHVWINVSCAL